MSLPDDSANDLITICKDGNHPLLFSLLQQPEVAEQALSHQNVLIDADIGTYRKRQTLQLMLEAATKAGHANIVESLLHFGQKHNIPASELVTKDVMSASLYENSLGVFLKLQAVDPDVFSRPLHKGSTVLGAACHGGPNSEPIPRKKHLSLVQQLMREGFDPNADASPDQERKGYLLHAACWQACREIIECLLEHGAVVEGSGASRIAAKKGRVDVLEMLLRYGADMNENYSEKDIGGPPGTPLHTAAAANQAAVVQWLLQNGANSSVRNSEGETAADYVSKEDNKDLKDILRQE